MMLSLFFLLLLVLMQTVAMVITQQNIYNQTLQTLSRIIHEKDNIAYAIFLYIAKHVAIASNKNHTIIDSIVFDPCIFGENQPITITGKINNKIINEYEILIILSSKNSKKEYTGLIHINNNNFDIITFKENAKPTSSY